MNLARATMFGAVCIALVLATPSLADVKAGVDAWGRGEYDRAVSEWRGPAAAGDADAQFNMAQAYRLGRGVDANARQAEIYYARAAEQGHLKAADNYGLLLFQDGRREEAMPYVRDAAGRGDPRAQYLLGIAHFNGDLVAKDWVKAYGLLTLANSAGLPQARPAIRQMDDFIPMAQRQQAQSLAVRLKQESDAQRFARLAAADLGGGTVQPRSTPPRAAALTPQPPAAAPVTSAGAAGGPWKVQLGAFGVPGNAEKLWARVAGRAELAGAQKVTVSAGQLTRLLAGGFASRQAARQACDALKRGGQDCLVIR